MSKRLAALGGRARSLFVPAAILLALGGALVVEAERRRTHSLGSPPALGWVLFALAAAALSLGARESSPLRLAAPRPVSGLFRSPGRRLSLRAFAAALLCAAASVPLFIRLNDATTAQEAGWPANVGSWLLWLASLASFAAGLVLLGRHRRTVRLGPPPGWPPTLPRRTELAIVGTLSAVALALRVPALGAIPPGLWFDEAQNGIVGTELLSPGALHRVFLGDSTQMGSLYFYALGTLLELFGDSIWVLRLLPALAGALTVPLLYLLASRLFGWRVGLAAAGFLAASSWSLTFSRFGMASMPAVALDLAVYLCVVLGLRSGRLGWYAAGGILLGLNLHGYYIARLVPIVLLLLVVHFVFSARREAWRLRAGVAVFAAGAVLAFLPVGLFAIQNPDAYQARTSTVSIFSELGSAGDPDALRKSLRAHLLMFNFRGDLNGRHNIPGSPLLDWLTAAFFFSGLAVCLLRIRRWEYFFPLVWFSAALAGGVLTLLIEAPQSHRTLENAVVTALLAGIFMGECWRLFTRTGPAHRMMAAVAAGGALAAVGGAATMNVEKYFFRQADNPAVWSDMGADKLEAGRLLRRYAPRRVVWMSRIFADQPAVRFLAPEARPLTWRAERNFPLMGTRDTLLILHANPPPELGMIAETYPRARFEAFRGPDGTPLVYRVFVPVRDLEATHGALALSPGAPYRRLATFAVRGKRSGALRLVATVKVPSFGRYRFHWSSSSGGRARVRVDDRVLAPGRARRLAAGLHRLEIAAIAGRGSGTLLWANRRSDFRPLSPAIVFDPRRVWPRGLVGTYRDGNEFRGPAVFERVDPYVGIDFTDPLSSPFTVAWRGELYAPVTGVYSLGTHQNDTMRVFVDGRRLLVNESREQQERPLRLRAGWHRVGLLYQGLTGYFNAYFVWTPPGRSTSVVPSAFLRPRQPAGPPFPPRPRLADSDGSLPPGRLADGGEG